MRARLLQIGLRRKLSEVGREAMPMDKEQLLEEITDLQEKIKDLEAKKPVHDTRGLYQRRMMELRDELEGKQKDLQLLESR